MKVEILNKGANFKLLVFTLGFGRGVRLYNFRNELEMGFPRKSLTNLQGRLRQLHYQKS